MRDIIIVSKPMEEADAIILSVPYEGTVSGSHGASFGPSFVIDAMKHQLEDYDRFNDCVISDSVNIIEAEIPVKNISPEEMVRAVFEKTKSVLNMNKFPVLLGGEHSVSIGALEAVSEKYPSLTVFQIDAHGDLREDDGDYVDDGLTPSKYAHCCVMRRAREFGFHTVQVGLRELYSKEVNYIKENRLEEKIFMCPVKSSPEDIINSIPTENIYLTIDVDGFDPSVMPETGTPVAGGLDWYFTIDLLRELFLRKNVVGFDLVEVSPFLENNLTAKNAAQLIYTLTGFKFSQKK